MIIAFFVTLFLLGIGIGIRFFKWYWLIAGYNTLPEKQKKEVDIQGLSKFIGNCLLLLAGLFLLGSYFNYIGNSFLFIISLVLFSIGIIYIVIKARHFSHQEPKERKTPGLVIGLILLISLGAIGVVIYGSMPPVIKIDSGYLKISGFYGTKQPIDQISDFELKTTLPAIIRKTNGFDAGSIKKGSFELKNLGEGRLYLRTRTGPYIYILTKSDFIIINSSNAEKTRELYNNILSTTFGQLD